MGSSVTVESVSSVTSKLGEHSTHRFFECLLSCFVFIKSHDFKKMTSTVPAKFVSNVTFPQKLLNLGEPTIRTLVISSWATYSAQSSRIRRNELSALVAGNTQIQLNFSTTMNLVNIFI